jgi:hypothetical protein
VRAERHGLVVIHKKGLEAASSLVVGIRDKYIAFAGYRARAVARRCMFPPENPITLIKMARGWSACLDLPKELLHLTPPRQEFSNSWEKEEAGYTLAFASLTP